MTRAGRPTSESQDGVLTATETRVNQGAMTVVVPTHNAERTLAPCLASLRAQSQPCRMFDQAGRFDEQLTGPENWDLNLSARQLAPFARTMAVIDHDEGPVDYLDACEKSAYYAEGEARYMAKRGMPAHRQESRRPWLCSPRRLAKQYGAGLMALKTGEAIAVLLALGRTGQSSVPYADIRSSDWRCRWSTRGGGRARNLDDGTAQNGLRSPLAEVGMRFGTVDDTLSDVRKEGRRCLKARRENERQSSLGRVLWASTMCAS